MTIPQITHTPDGRYALTCPGCKSGPVVTPFLEVARRMSKLHVCSPVRPADEGGDAA